MIKMIFWVYFLVLKASCAPALYEITDITAITLMQLQKSSFFNTYMYTYDNVNQFLFVELTFNSRKSRIPTLICKNL